MYTHILGIGCLFGKARTYLSVTKKRGRPGLKSQGPCFPQACMLVLHLEISFTLKMILQKSATEAPAMPRKLILFPRHTQSSVKMIGRRSVPSCPKIQITLSQESSIWLGSPWELKQSLELSTLKVLPSLISWVKAFRDWFVFSIPVQETKLYLCCKHTHVINTWL